VEVGFRLTNDGVWREAIVDLPAIVFQAFGTLPANSTMIYVGLHPPPEGESELWMDDLQLIEWRDPASMHDGWFETVLVRPRLPGPPVAATLERRER
jgi:hypothetical protein